LPTSGWTRSSLSGVSPEQLRTGVVIGVPDRSDEIEVRLQPGGTFSAELEGESTGEAASIELGVASEYYLETGDLAAV
jgi:hypothetical protein